MEAVVAQLRYHYGIALEGLSKTAIRVTPSRDSNRSHSEHKSKELLLDQNVRFQVL
jgi:hypothetical protein